MQSFSDTMRLLLVLLLLVPVQMRNLPGDERPRTMGLKEAITKSSCQPIAQHVNVAAEFPDGVEYIYTPSCVLLFRCSGCCMDEALECYPTSKRNITVEVYRSNQIVNLTFLEHQACEVRPNAQYQSITRDMPPRRRRRRSRRSCEKCQLS